jgi:hypothetical protein
MAMKLGAMNRNSASGILGASTATKRGAGASIVSQSAKIIPVSLAVPGSLVWTGGGARSLVAGIIMTSLHAYPTIVAGTL